jgi:hypothetical protein
MGHGSRFAPAGVAKGQMLGTGTNHVMKGLVTDVILSIAECLASRPYGGAEVTDSTAGELGAGRESGSAILVHSLGEIAGTIRIVSSGVKKDSSDVRHL